MKQLLLFPENKTQDALVQSQPQDRFYIAVIAEELHYQELQALAPTMMCWDHNCWLIDLSQCYRYWQHQSQRCNMRIEELLRALTRDACGSSFFHAAMSHSPWQSVLLAKSLEEKGIPGFVSILSQMGMNIYRHLSWNIWWHCCQRFSELASLSSVYKSKDVTEIRQKLLQMQRSMKRLGVHRPYQIHEMPYQQIKRRFGRVLSELWKHAFSVQHETLLSENLDEGFFPWQPYEHKDKACKKTNLDHPLIEWPQIEACLRNDLNSLCLLESFKEDHRILKMEWRVVLQDLTEVPIIIPFRHPHNLHCDTPHQRTALLQIHYQFEAFRSEIEKEFQEFESPPPPIISWQLIIDQSIFITPKYQALFSEGEPNDTPLLAIENQLRLPLEHYSINQNWIPERSYQMQTEGFTSDQPDEALASLESVAITRPLYILEKPEKLNLDGTSAIWKFCERSLDQWWVNAERNQERDYYCYISQSRHLWVFQNLKGDWFIHGIYG